MKVRKESILLYIYEFPTTSSIQIDIISNFHLSNVHYVILFPIGLSQLEGKLWEKKNIWAFKIPYVIVKFLDIFFMKL